MKIQIYGDIVFLINFCMDYILLAFMCKILVCKSSRIRRTAAAALGGIGSVAAFYIPVAAGTALQFFLGAVMCAIAAPCRKIKPLFVRLAVFCSSALIFGGGVLAVLCAMGANVFVKSGAFYIDMNAGILIFSAIICRALLWILEKILKSAKPNCRKSVTVEFMGKSVTLRGYVDTGNTLTCGGVPVILASWDAAKELFPENSSSSDFFMKCPPDKVRAASYKAVGGGGVVWCAVPDYVCVDGKKQNALIGICRHTLSSEYDALLSSVM